MIQYFIGFIFATRINVVDLLACQLLLIHWKPKIDNGWPQTKYFSVFVTEVIWILLISLIIFFLVQPSSSLVSSHHLSLILSIWGRLSKSSEIKLDRNSKGRAISSDSWRCANLACVPICYISTVALIFGSSSSFFLFCSFKKKKNPNSSSFLMLRNIFNERSRKFSFWWSSI